jgi:hypothetical protein
MAIMDNKFDPRQQKSGSKLFFCTQRESKSNNELSIQPKPSDDILAYPSIINLIRQTCIRLAYKEVLQVRLDTRQKIEINSSSMMEGEWLFDIGAGLTSMPS